MTQPKQNLHGFRHRYDCNYHYSALMLGIVTSLMAVNSAAVETGANLSSNDEINALMSDAIKADSIVTKSDSAVNTTDESSNEISTLDVNPTQLEQALIALRLKRAVEKGTIDPSVLEAYQRETLNKDTSQSQTLEVFDSHVPDSHIADFEPSDSQVSNSQILNSQSPSSQVSGLSSPSLNTPNLNTPNLTSSLNVPNDVTVTDDDDPLLVDDSLLNNNLYNDNVPDNSGRQDNSEPQDNSTIDNDTQESNNKAIEPQNMAHNTEANFEQALKDADISPIKLQTSSVNFDSPEQIEQLFADIDVSHVGDFSAPIARLDDTALPLGLDTSLEDTANVISAQVANNDTLYENIATNLTTQSILPEPKPIEVLDPNIPAKSQQPPVTQPNAIASKTAGTGQVPAGEDITNSPNLDAIAAVNQSTVNPNTVNPNTVNPNTVNQNIVNRHNSVTGARIEQAQGQPIVADSTTFDSRASEDKGQDSTMTASTSINPKDFLPDYEPSEPKTDEAEALQNSLKTATDAKRDIKSSGKGFIKRIYNRLFNDGVNGLERINATVYIQDGTQVTADGRPVLIKADEDQQPMNNIRAAIENITAEVITDFPAAAPRLNEEALNASRAVGYYDINLHFEKVSSSDVNIVIERLGEPVTVANRIIEARGEGSDLDAFTQIEERGVPLEGDIFNHGAYKNTKFAIDAVSESYGFFDGQWLNNSVDVILPDNTADMALVYSTGERYNFDDVVFYTLDKESKELTQDTDKLPLNIELLRQLYHFEAGEPYYQPLITEFSNDLSATQYFNTVNVETVMPSSDTNATLSVVNEPSDTDETDSIKSADTNAGLDINHTDQPILANAGNANNNSNDDNNIDTDININDDANDDAYIEPIHFDIDEQTAVKLKAIKAKAQRLSALPDDRVLDTQEESAKNLLGKISEGISNVVKKILPDETDTLLNVDENFVAPTLAGKITPQEVKETKHVPVYVFVMADKPRDAQLGIGYGTDTGVRTVAQLQHNLINKQGYQAGIKVGASDIRKTVNVDVSRPWTHPLDDTLHANLAYEREIINQGEGNLDLTTDTIKAGIARNIRPPSGWDRTYSLRYRLDELESGVTGANREELPEPFNRRDAKFTQQSLLLGYSMAKVQSDNIMDPTHGFSQFYSVEAGGDSVLTDTNMAIFRARLGTVQSFGAFDKHQIVANLDTGYIWADEFFDVPYKQRFFAGGDRSLRGYDYNSLSALKNGYAVGGQVLALANVEYNYEFKPKLRAAVFADVGNAYDTNFEADTKLGVGAGIRWSSPVGLVRLDVAAGVLEDEIPIRLHFFIGSPLY